MESLDSETFRALVDHSPCIVIGLDASGLIRWCNKALWECLGYTKGDLIQNNITDFCPDTENQGRIRRLISLTELQHEVFDFDVTLQSHDLNRIELLLNSAAVGRDVDGESAGIICFGKDATKQRMLEKEVQRASEESRALFDLSSLPVFGVDHRGIIDVWNSRLAAITGVSSEVFVAQSAANGMLEE